MKAYPWFDQIRTTLALSALYFGYGIQYAAADWWDVPQEWRIVSEDGRAIAVISPRAGGPAEAKVYRQGRSGDTLVWSGPLVNNEAPVDAFVSDNGNTLVTLDDWVNLGTHAVVIYDEKGRTLADHDYKALSKSLLKEAEPKAGLSGVLWRRNCIVMFGPRNETLCLRFPAGTVLVFDVATGKHLTNEAGQLGEKRDEATAYVQKSLPQVVAKLLVSKSKRDLETGAIVAGQLRLRDTADTLRTLLKDPSGLLIGPDEKHANWWRYYHIRKAAKDALEAMGYEVGPVVIEGPDLDP